jgi:hypothetical protein
MARWTTNDLEQQLSSEVDCAVHDRAEIVRPHVRLFNQSAYGQESSNIGRPGLRSEGWAVLGQAMLRLRHPARKRTPLLCS